MIHARHYFVDRVVHAEVHQQATLQQRAHQIVFGEPVELLVLQLRLYRFKFGLQVLRLFDGDTLQIKANGLVVASGNGAGGFAIAKTRIDKAFVGG